MKKAFMILVILLVLAACNTSKEVSQQGQDLGYSVREDINNEVVEMPKQVHAEHILVKTNEEANSILFDLNRGGNFEDIARARSICPSGKKGGDLGWFGRGMMVKEFEDAAFATPAGNISGIVKTQFGYHIIKVLETK